MEAQKQEWEWLAFGAHPDDVEIGAGGLIAQEVRKGYQAAICDLTAGELSSNGDPVTRRREAVAAGAVLGVGKRVCLGLADRGLKNDDEHRTRIVEIIRQLRPRFVLCPWPGDSHPDHALAGQLVREAVLNARLRRYGEGEPWAVERVWDYFIHEMPLSLGSGHSVYVKISPEAAGAKMRALACYESQFVKGNESVSTRLHGLKERIEYRDRYTGSLIGAEWGERFFQIEEIAVRDLRHLI